jgi:glucose-6-phosphate dehydrogenase assembly protein OpcA
VPGGLFEIPQLNEFVALFDRVIIDAHNFTEAETEIDRFAAWKAGYPKVSAIDMAWLRLEKWRSLTAQLFDDPTALQDLKRLQRVEVDYLVGADGSPEGRVEAIYFVSWIASRLRLTPCALERESARETTYLARSEDGRECRFVLRSLTREGSALGDLSRVSLSTKIDACRYDIIRHETRKVATVHVQRESSCPLPTQVELPSASDTELIQSALEWQSAYSIFSDSLKTAREFLSLRKSGVTGQAQEN